MAKNDKSGRNGKAASKKSVEKLAKAIDRLADQLAALEAKQVLDRSDLLKQIAALKATGAKPAPTRKAPVRRKKATTASAKTAAKPRVKTAQRTPRAKPAAKSVSRKAP